MKPIHKDLTLDKVITDMKVLEGELEELINKFHDKHQLPISAIEFQSFKQTRYSGDPDYRFRCRVTASIKIDRDVGRY